VMRSLKALENCDVCLLVIDAQEGLESQDLNLFALAEKNHKGIIILVNKWDLVEKDNHTMAKYEELIHEKIKPFKDVPILFISALTKQRIFNVLETAQRVYDNLGKKIKTRELNDHMLPILQHQPPPALNGHYIKIKFVTQLPTRFPAFAFFCNQPQLVKENYRRFIENKMREKYDFSGVPIEIYFRPK
jgi:GTPase